MAVSKAKLKYGVTIPRISSTVGRRKPHLPMEQLLLSQESDKSIATVEKGDSGSTGAGTRLSLGSTDRSRGESERASFASSASAVETPPVLPASMGAPFASGKQRKPSLRTRARGLLRPMDSVCEREERHLTFDDENDLSLRSRSRSFARNVARFGDGFLLANDLENE